MARSLIPWRGGDRGGELPLASLRDEMDRLFEDFGRGFLPGRWFGEKGWAPLVDVEETDKEVVVKAEVPGMKANEIDIDVRNDVLTIRGERKEEKEDKTKTYHRIERRVGSFERAVSLPAGVDADKAKAAYKDGVLEITLPKKPEVKGKSIKFKPEEAE